MGCFSWDCRGCTHSVRDGGVADWMAKAVVLDAEGSRIVGEYNGYGSVGNGRTRIQDMTNPQVWHRACYVVSGKPEYTGPSKSADDQGLHNEQEPEPTKVEHLVALKEVKQIHLREQRELIKANWTKEVAAMHARGEEVPKYAMRFAETGE